MGNPEDEIVASFVPYEFAEQAQLFMDTLRVKISELKINHTLETVDYWDESEERTTGFGKRASFLLGLKLRDEARAAQLMSDREDHLSTKRELVGVACYGKIEIKIEDALDEIERIAAGFGGVILSEPDQWQDLDHGTMVGARVFVFNG